MRLAFANRPPNRCEVEKIRLILSTFQDGTGQEGAGKLPGWRDFERTVATALDGDASESKAVFDVLLANQERPGSRRYGLSCKMRGELNRFDRDGRVTIEVSNSLGKFWDHLHAMGIDHANYRTKPYESGVALVDLVRHWHVAEHANRNIGLRRSYYLVLLWNKTGSYQLFQFRLNLFDECGLRWYFREPGDHHREARCLCADDGRGTIVEWYGESGGQLKFYPFSEDAIWQSAKFRLEPLSDIEGAILRKAEEYFPEAWARACRGR